MLNENRFLGTFRGHNTRTNTLKKRTRIFGILKNTKGVGGFFARLSSDIN